MLPHDHKMVRIIVHVYVICLIDNGVSRTETAQSMRRAVLEGLQINF